MAQVTLESVRKVYGKDVVAVESFGLDIADGEFIVLVGPSGCGKSTTLRMVAGLEEITGGTVRIGERVVNNVLPKDRDIAMVFQNYALYPHMTVYKNMAFGLTLRKMPREEISKRVNEAADLLGISHLLERKPKALSGGQRQRVALGRAIVREPSVFLFDEPLSNLDAKLRATTRTEIKRLHKRLRTTTIYVTHDQTEAMTLGDRIVVMSDGKVQQVDTPLGVYKRPANRFVGAFVGATPMNFVEGKIESADDGLWFTAPAANSMPGVRIRMTDDVSGRLAEHTGKPLTLGWRPSAMSEHAEGKFAIFGNQITLRTAVVEPLGKNIDVSCELPDGSHVLARIDAREDFPVGEDVPFYLDMDHVHIFEPSEFGRNLSHPART
ncbi:MAG: sn-glycerol-3-phosphate ABC transporter ATP-binding protein UgpC [Planctomycetota bacterium]